MLNFVHMVFFFNFLICDDRYDLHFTGNKFKNRNITHTHTKEKDQKANINHLYHLRSTFFKSLRLNCPSKTTTNILI